MNWRFLHTGLAGVAEAALIAFVLGVFFFACFHQLGRRRDWPQGQALGWACIVALLLSSIIDFFLLMQVFRLNPLYPSRIKLVLQKIHDPEWLGIRFLAEVFGALAGAVVGWAWVESRAARRRDRQAHIDND
jgi:hypothetical protein